ncbi:MAG: hypothetical protein IPF92_14220 [Myxococcales bacterium]|nr:hypothetical protein [Myxococcales bacterium]
MSGSSSAVKNVPVERHTTATAMPASLMVAQKVTQWQPTSAPTATSSASRRGDVRKGTRRRTITTAIVSATITTR